jgi:hypothetical protein
MNKFLFLYTLLISCSNYSTSYSIPPTCKVGIKHGGNCLLIVNNEVSWYTAEETCETMEGWLYNPENTAEAIFLSRITGGRITWVSRPFEHNLDYCWCIGYWGDFELTLCEPEEGDFTPSTFVCEVPL